MKKLITFLILFGSFSLFAQEVERQKVIVEVGTGTWCPSCPAVVDILHDFLDQGLEIAIVEYHNNDPFTNPASIIRENYYNFPWFPTTYYDSNHIGYNDWATQSVHYQYYLDRMNTPSSFTAAIEANVDGDVLSGTVTLDKVAAYDGQNLVLHVVVTESDIPFNWQGQTEVDHAERAMFPDGHGTAIDFSTEDHLEIDFNFNLDPTWVKENCEITFFIQDNDTKEILQGDYIDVEEVILSNGGDLTQQSPAYFYSTPSSGKLQLYASDINAIKDIKMYDMLGNTIFSQKSFTQDISISNVSNGVYIVSFYENDIRRTSKIIKQ